MNCTEYNSVYAAHSGRHVNIKYNEHYTSSRLHKICYCIENNHIFPKLNNLKMVVTRCK